ncbi:MAG: flagellar basal body P-ring protein FlgI [Planctomycetota bacterium]|jgi:flagellar P-ring protein precursor FlgI|nr:flagellar basal body P-ring protein FlgI [Planctomycetota bacterium]
MTKRILALSLGVVLLLAVVARAESVKDLVTVNEMIPVQVEGVGIVTGLPKTGDKSKATLEMLRKFLSENNENFDAKDLASGNIALVSVFAELQPFGRPGQRFPVTVTSIGDATDLNGGELRVCQLRTGKGDVYALASGQVVAGTGIKTRGIIQDGLNSGAMQIAAYPFGDNIQDQGGFIRLNLNRPNFADATAIARQINQTPSLNPNVRDSYMFSEGSPVQPIAFVRDPGQVAVHVPGQFGNNLHAYISQILDVPVAVDRTARIVINRAKNSIVVTGDIQVNNAVVSLQDKTVTIRPETEAEPAAYALADDTPRRLVEMHGPGSYADLQGLIDTLNAMGLTTNEIITIFEELRTAGAIKAEFVGQ